MKKETQFKINSIWELKKAYHFLGEVWCYSLEQEISEFLNFTRWRYIIKNTAGKVLLTSYHPKYKVINSPFEKYKKNKNNE